MTKQPPIPSGGRWPPKLTAAELHSLIEAADGPYTDGPYTAAVERKMCLITGAPYAVAFNSCTSAIHAALTAMGVDQTSVVTAPSFTFAGTVTGVAHLGAGLDLVDVDRDTLTISGPFSHRSKVVIAVDLHGVPHFYDRSGDKAGRRVLNDSCQALGAKVGGRRIGWRGTHCWSFSAAKMVPAPDGGCVTTDDHLLAAQLRELRDYGTSARQGVGRANANVIWRRGHNWRPSELSMALVSHRLGQLDERVRRSNEVDLTLKEAALEVGWWVQTCDADTEPAWHKTRVGPMSWNPSVADDLERALHEQGVPTHRWGEIALHEMTAYRPIDHWWGSNPVASAAGTGTFCLGTEAAPPMTWTDAEVERAVRAIRTVGGQIRDHQ